MYGEELSDQNALVTMQLRAVNLDNKETFSRSDPFIRFSKLREDGTYVPCFKTEVKMNNLSPVSGYLHLLSLTSLMHNNRPGTDSREASCKLPTEMSSVRCDWSVLIGKPMATIGSSELARHHSMI